LCITVEPLQTPLLNLVRQAVMTYNVGMGIIAKANYDIIEFKMKFTTPIIGSAHMTTFLSK